MVPCLAGQLGSGAAPEGWAGAGSPGGAAFVGDERSAETWHPDSVWTPRLRPPGRPGPPSPVCLAYRRPAPRWAVTCLAGVCEPPRPSHPGWALSAMCLHWPIVATKPPSGARPTPRSGPASSGPLPRRPRRGGFPWSSAKRACPPLMSPLGCGRAGGTSPRHAPSEPWHRMAGAPKASLWPPSLSLSVRENKFRAGCPASPKDACFPEVWPAGPRPFKAPLRLSLTSAPPTPRRPLSHTQRLQGPQPASQSLGALTFESSLVSALRFSNLHVLALP